MQIDHSNVVELILGLANNLEQRTFRKPTIVIVNTTVWRALEELSAQMTHVVERVGDPLNGSHIATLYGMHVVVDYDAREPISVGYGLTSFS